MHRPYVLTIVGPESSGKTTLARQLAESRDIPWVPEYARTYLEARGPAYSVEDLPRIARGQQDALDNVLHRMSASSFGLPGPDVIVDSGVLSVAVWAELKYGHVPAGVDELLASDPTTLYLVLRPSLEWTPDPLREAPDLLTRAWIYNHFLRRLQAMGKAFRVR